MEISVRLRWGREADQIDHFVKRKNCAVQGSSMFIRDLEKCELLLKFHV